MAAFQEIREETEQKVLVHLLSEIERNPSFTQRGLATELGIALGLMNQYLKRCVTKGWVRGSQVSPRRITYFLTSEGFREKSQMVAGYLSRSMSFFRDAKVQCEDAFNHCISHGWSRVALVGEGDLADIVRLVAQGTGIKVDFSHEHFNEYDAVMVTDVVTPQQTYQQLREKVEAGRIITLPLLHISRAE